VVLSRVGLLDDFGAATGAGLQGALLIGAALWQVSPVKTRCQSVCLSPMAYFLGRFRPGLRGGLRMGAEIGLACLGCCWAIMALGFVGGVMNLAWMGLATVFMVLEKLPGVGHALRLPAGLLLGAAGLAVLAAAFI
jgi:predicted metal-binding membrane protein